MGKKQKSTRSKGAPVRTMPRNTVSLVLDGTEQEYLHNYRRCMSYFRYWMLCNAAMRVRFGNRLVYTTPIDGTFYFTMRSRGRYIVFPIVVRMVWLVGFYTANGVFQMEFEDQSCPYMDSDQCQSTGFKGGHGVITAGRTGDTRLGLHRIRDCFDSIVDYRGPDYPEPPGFRPALGTVVIHLMEAKAREIYDRNCLGIIDPRISRLGLGLLELLILNYKSLSKEGMLGINDPEYAISNRGIVEITCLGHILDGIFFLHVDAYNEGIFIHDALPAAPRQMTWRPIDPGEGDGDIPLLVEKAVARLPGHRCGGMSSRDAIEDDTRRRGLTGGGAGGPPVVPEWFMQWEQRDNELQCNAVEYYLSELGLLVHHQRCSAPGPATAPDTASALIKLEEHVLCHGNAKLYRDDINSLEDEGLLLDGVIEFVFARLTSSFAREEDVLLVPPAPAILLGSLGDPVVVVAHAEPLLLNTRRVVLFAVNNSQDLDVVDSGDHWSLLVVHIAEDRGSCRFVHHDSWGQTNLSAADRLADALRPLLPAAPPLIHGDTPQQVNTFDCGLYVLAVSKVICSWWAESGRPGISNCWFEAVMSKVDAAGVTAFRAALRSKLHREIKDHPSDCGK